MGVDGHQCIYCTGPFTYGEVRIGQYVVVHRKPFQCFKWILQGTQPVPCTYIMEV